MAREPSVGRKTPYEVLFGAEGLTESRFAAIRDEAMKTGFMTARRDHFASLNPARQLLVDLVPELAEPAALDRYLGILYHCFCFWEAGCHHFAFEESAVRSVITRAPDLSGWLPHFEYSSAYLELPQNLFWAAVVEDEPPEPVEGMFVKLGADRAAEEADILLALGIRPDRPGFSVAELTVDLAAGCGVSEPHSFVSDLPGGDLAELYSLQRPAEVVVLLLRLLWYIDVYPESVGRNPRFPAGDHGGVGYAAASAFDHYRVRAVERSRG